MPLVTGTHDVASLLAQKQTTAAAFGLDTIAEILQADLATHNQLVDQIVAEMADVSADRLRLSGGSTGGDMVEVDQYGQAPTQKPGVGSSVGFPLRLYQFNLGWTQKWLEQNTAADMAVATLGAEKAHLRGIQRAIKRAVYLSSNYTFTDRLVAPSADLPVKRFVNADGQAIPDGPNGETFDASTHTHYTANATLTAAAVQSLIDTVLEHGLNDGKLVLAIARADRTAFEALVGFKAYSDPRITYHATDVNTATIDLTRQDNLAIGTFGAAEVWVKPWAIANYVLAYVAGGSMKPLVMRTRAGSSNLAIAATLADYPLHAQFMEAEFGVGVWTRTAGGVLYFAGGAYTDPTI